MSAVNSVNPGIADLFQLLSNTGSASVSSPLSSPALQSALQNASPSDVVQLSLQALQLQDVSSLFGSPGSSQTAVTADNLLLQALNSSISGSTTTGSTASPSTAATEAAASALEQASSLFGSFLG